MAEHFFCNKCGYSGPTQFPHQRPNGTGECGYMAVLVPPSPPGQCKHLGECTDQRACFGPTPGCRRALGVPRPVTAQEDRFLSRAVREAGRVVAPGKLADGVAASHRGPAK
jgi:hypothetical protein